MKIFNLVITYKQIIQEILRAMLLKGIFMFILQLGSFLH